MNLLTFDAMPSVKAREYPTECPTGPCLLRLYDLEHLATSLAPEDDWRETPPVAEGLVQSLRHAIGAYYARYMAWDGSDWAERDVTNARDWIKARAMKDDYGIAVQPQFGQMTWMTDFLEQVSCAEEDFIFLRSIVRYVVNVEDDYRLGQRGKDSGGYGPYFAPNGRTNLGIHLANFFGIAEAAARVHQGSPIGESTCVTGHGARCLAMTLNMSVRALSAGMTDIAGTPAGGIFYGETFGIRHAHKLAKARARFAWKEAYPSAALRAFLTKNILGGDEEDE